MYQHFFESNPLIARSPGRINIIGEHTDYNYGFVLPAAIDKSITVAVEKRSDQQVCLYASASGSKYECHFDEIRPVGDWPDYVLGVVQQLRELGFALGGFTLVLDGNVPIGAGLSSSAAVECAVLFALDHLFGCNLDRFRMAGIAQAAEHAFAGVQCGIMDQFASLFGKKDHAIRLDCESMQYEYIPLQMEGLKIVLLNTNVSHSLASSEYNVRRQQCEQGVQWIRKQYPTVRSLRDATGEMLQNCVLHRDTVIYKRCRYVLEENQRLLSACTDLQNGNMAALGEKMFRSHVGLSREYEVSCRELDLLVNWVATDPAVLGARMMGGGFGGCTINLVQEQEIDRLVTSLGEKYYAATGLQLSAYTVSIENGTAILQ